MIARVIADWIWQKCGQESCGLELGSDFGLGNGRRYPWADGTGQSSYRGNCSGHVQKFLIEKFRPSYFVDPAEGGGTSRDVCQQMGIKYTGLDLKDGFNLLKHNLKDRLQGQPDFIFFHPPYGTMVPYSGAMWGNPHPDDLSRCGNGDEFINRLEIALMNIYDALKLYGFYSVLIGDMRRDGEYFSFQSDILQMGIGKLFGILIKAQFNCTSSTTQYSGSFIPIAHEYLLTFQRNKNIISFGQMLLQKDERIARRMAGTWKEIVYQALRDLGGTATIEETLNTVMKRIDPAGNHHVAAKIRQTLQNPLFFRVSQGVYSVSLN